MIFRHIIAPILFFTSGTQHLVAQVDSSLFRTATPDTDSNVLNMDAIYTRPYLVSGNYPVAIGGYLESNWQHSGTDGVSEGHQFQFRRLTLFFSSTITRRIRFLTEIEFEDGARHIAIEFAALDFELHPLLNLRGGMILNPIGAFNQNHDGPKWEFTDRPLASTELLPATWSNPGFGLYGKWYQGSLMFGYETYITSGLNDSVISNSQGRTFLPAVKNKPDRFSGNGNGEILWNGKLACKHNKLGEIGVSAFTGIYNTWQAGGLQTDFKRRCSAWAIDYNNSIKSWGTRIVGEWVCIRTEIPESYSQQFGAKQHGGFVDIIQPLIKRPFLHWEQAEINLAVRLEYLDYNRDTFSETAERIHDETSSIVAGLGFRPSTQTILRLNYHYRLQKDLLGNPPEQSATISLGISSYF